MENQSNSGYEYVRPHLYEKQRGALFSKAKLVVTLGSTKSGKSISHLVWLFEQAVKYKKPNKQGIFWWVSPSYSQSKIMFRRLKGYVPSSVYSASETELKVSFHHNGSVIWFKSAEDIDKLYGEDVSGIVVDEASRCKEAIYTLAQSVTTATNGKIRMIGNVKGRNWFYRLYEKLRLEKLYPNYRTVNLTVNDAIEAGVLKQEVVDLIKQSLPEAVFNELYLNIPNDENSNPFGIKHIAGAVRDISSKQPVKFGVDLAKSEDWTVIIGLDEDGCVCWYERFQADWTVTIEKLKRLPNVPMLLDGSGNGSPVVEILQKSKSRVEGFVFTSKSKQQLMEGLAIAIQHQEVFFPDNEIRAELDAFAYGLSQSGNIIYTTHLKHDDCVCALALAVKCGQRGEGLWDLITEAA